MTTLRAAINGIDRLCFGLGGLFTLYMAVSAFWLLQESINHYATLVFAIVLISGLLVLRRVLAEGQQRRGYRFWTRLTLAGVMLVTGVVSTSYFRLNGLRLQIEAPFLGDFDIVMGAVLLVAVLLANWFLWGAILTLVIAVVIVYFFFGHLIGNPILRHAPYEWNFVMSYMGMNGTEGLFSYIPDGVEKLYFLVIFSAVLIGSGMVTLVLEMGKAGGRYFRGGAAFPSIFGSAMVGSVMGAAVSNVILTGRLTIPMMKRAGFKSEMAGAIEATASTAGQIIPPVMGLAAFIMAALLNIPYITVVLLAVVPSLLYISGVTIAVLVKANADDLPRLQERPNLLAVGRLLPTFVIPFAVVLTLMLLFYSPAIAGVAGTAVVFVLAPLQREFRPSLLQMKHALGEGFETAIGLSLLILAIGPLAQTFVTTNLAGRLSAVLIQVLPEIQLILLVVAMGLALLTGMGLPTPAAYVLVALTVAHFIQGVGVKAIPTHFFIQYFAVFSALTPPVALASLAGAQVAGAPFLRTAWEALRLTLPIFLVPFAFIYHPALLEFPRVSVAMLVAIGACVVFQLVSSVALYGYFFRTPLNVVERGAFALAALIGATYLVAPRPVYLWVFLAAVVIEVLWVVAGKRKASRHPSPASELAPASAFAAAPLPVGGDPEESR